MFTKTLRAATLAVAFSLAGGAVALAPVQAFANPKVGGAPMYANKTIVQNAVNSPIHKTLVAAVKAAGLVDTLNGPGPFTVFAPTDSAFKALPKGTVETLVKPENKAKLTKILTAHVVAGKLSGPELLRDVNSHGGKYALKTVSGDTLTVVKAGKGLAVIDENGGKAEITTADVNQSNGVIHVVNKVLLPK